MQLLVISLLCFISTVSADEDDYRYEAFNGCVTWHGALATCQELSGRLAVISSQAIQDKVVTSIRVKGLSLRTFWLNGHDRTVEGQWMTDEGDPLTFYNWNRGQPDNEVLLSYSQPGCGGADNCALVEGQSLKWNDAPCLNRLGYICQFGKNGPIGGRGTIATTESQPANGNTTGRKFSTAAISNSLKIEDAVRYSSISDRRTITIAPKPNKDKTVKSSYEIIPGCQSWYGSKAVCADRGGRLATISNKETQLTIEGLIAERGYQHFRFWFDANDETQEGHWTNSNGNPQPYYNWAPGQPNNYGYRRHCPGLEDCAVLLTKSEQHKWNDFMCIVPFGYICEYDTIVTDEEEDLVTTLTTTSIPSTSNDSGSTSSTGTGSIKGNPSTNKFDKPNQTGERKDSALYSQRNEQSPVPTMVAIELVLSFIILLLLLSGVVAFLYLSVWRKRKTTIIPKPFYQDLEETRSTQELCTSKV